MTALLLTGSNAPDREQILVRTASLLEQRVGEIVRRSRVYTSEPWGFHADEPFANQALMLRTSLSPLQVLEAALEVEQVVGRNRAQEQMEKRATGERYASRTVDVDVMFYESEVIRSERLTLPHPLLHVREFALTPLCEIAGEMVHPVLGLTLAEIREELMADSLGNR